MNHLTRRLTVGLVTAAVGSLAAAAAVASPAAAGAIVHHVGGQPTSGTPEDEAAPAEAADYPPGPSIIPCL